jgi:hypothetical protein
MRWLYPVISFCFVVLIAYPQTVGAVQVFLNTESESNTEGNTFYVPVRIDTQKECINAVSVAIAYNPTEISIRDVAIGESIISLWTQVPVIDSLDGVETGRVRFEGGIPGGYCGRVVGDAGQTNILAKLVVVGLSQATSSEEGKKSQIVVEPSTKVYLHDGSGTEANITVLGVDVLLQPASSTPENIWLTDIKSDAIAPELFEIIFVKGPSEGNNKHYIVFNTTDKQSGVDHYEVLETDPDRFGFLTWVPKEAYWVPAISPCVLRDQNLHSKIMVKAVDKNGNERIVTYTSETSSFEQFVQPKVLLPLALTLSFLMFAILFVVFRKKKWKKEESISQYQGE